jgi:hypothetical protein
MFGLILVVLEMAFRIHEAAWMFCNFLLDAGMRSEKGFQLKMLCEVIRIRQQAGILSDILFNARMLIHEIIECGKIRFRNIAARSFECLEAAHQRFRIFLRGPADVGMAGEEAFQFGVVREIGGIVQLKERAWKRRIS